MLLITDIIRNYGKQRKLFPFQKKKKKLTDPADYRPVSLTPSISKVYESVINNSITRFCNSNNILPDNQFGFRRQHSTIHACNKFLTDINFHLHNKHVVGAIIIDLEKAFDSVWLNGLIYSPKTFSHLLNSSYRRHDT